MCHISFDFSFSLYLGLGHSSRELDGWAQLTTGFPAAFSEPGLSTQVGSSVARLQGLADGVAAPSSLHLFWDWFGRLEAHRDVVFFDEHLYQVGKSGVERAAGRGVKVVKFRHQCPGSLESAIGQFLKSGQRPVVVTDGWCPLCGKPAPLRDYLEILEAFEGLLVLDDTQAFGILGETPSNVNPYGWGGGGLLRYLNLQSNRVLCISSLAKAFGAPVAVLSGSINEVKVFRERSETRMFSSPPSMADLQAANNALRLNSISGNAVRERLLGNVRRFKNGMAQRGFETRGGFFPVQSLALPREIQTRAFHERLTQKGIRTVLARDHDGKPRVCWLLNARQCKEDIERAIKGIQFF